VPGPSKAPPRMLGWISFTPEAGDCGRRIRYASQKVPSMRTHLAQPAQFPGSASDTEITTSAFS
jgi:hypothetical protein